MMIWKDMSRMEKFGVGVIVATAAFQIWGVVFFDRRDPLPNGFERVEALNSPIEPGQRLLLRVWREKVRDDCPISVQRTVYDMDGRAYVIPGNASDGRPADLDFIDLKYDTSALPIGRYEVEARVTYTCPGGLTFNHLQPRVPFRVFDPALQQPAAGGGIGEGDAVQR